MRRWILAATFIFGAVSWTVAQQAPPAEDREAAKGPQRFGVDGLTLKWLDRIAQLGDGWTGVNGLSWRHIEPRPPTARGVHTYYWSRLDDALRAFQTSGRRIQLNLKEASNRWAVESDDSRMIIVPDTGASRPAAVRLHPRHRADWAAFVSALVERYDGDGHADMRGLTHPVAHLQIGGSEAASVWAEASGYVESLCLAREAAEQANPTTQMLAGGFNLGDFFALSADQQLAVRRQPSMQHTLQFVETVLAQAEACFDILSIHLHRGDEAIAPTVRWFREQMAQRGYTKPIWVDDMSSGPLLSGEGATEQDRARLERLEAGDPQMLAWFREEQARLVIKKAVVAFAAGVDKVFVSTDVDWPRHYLPSWRSMGLLDVQGRPKPAFEAVRTLVEKLDGFSIVGELPTLPAGVSGYRFLTPRGPVAVIWSDRERAIELPEWTAIVHVTERTGKRRLASSSSLEIGPSPVFVERIEVSVEGF